MTKVELIAAVANDANLTKKDAEAAVNSALNAITAALKDGDKVTLVEPSMLPDAMSDPGCAVLADAPGVGSA